MCVNSCTICLNDVEDSNVFKTKCNHTFHHKCMMEWLKDNNTCPVCRTELFEKTHEDEKERSFEVKILPNSNLLSFNHEELLLEYINNTLNIPCKMGWKRNKPGLLVCPQIRQVEWHQTKNILVHLLGKYHNR